MRHYIGIDFHKQHSSVAVMDNKGDIKDERKRNHPPNVVFISAYSAHVKM